jgi:hypothetical protein
LSPSIVYLGEAMALPISLGVALRYTAEKWLLLTGSVNVDNPHESVYAFTKEVLDYDLAVFFNRNRPSFKKQVTEVLEALLQPE